MYRTEENNVNKKSFYALSMFPYPSGSLHMGHVRNYVITDVIARFHRMNGCSVLHPMGWDAFGLPAENAAFLRGIDPSEWTKVNISQMKLQLKKLGLSIDWEREQNTSCKDYYKWTQFIFCELFKNNLAYRKESKVNWDPVDKTVLANEQVDNEGKSWRSGAKVEQKELKQWFLKITSYADLLNKDIEKLKGWPERVRTMQRNWIGKSEGAEIRFKVNDNSNKEIIVYTTRPDTLFGVSYIVLSPNNKSVNELTSSNYKDRVKKFQNDIDKYRKNVNKDLNKDKSGCPIGAEVINPVNGEIIPIWIADYVLADYGSGAVMGVPAHDQRDYEFASKYRLPINYVISKSDDTYETSQAFTDQGTLINSREFTGMSSKEAKIKILDKGIKENWADRKIQYKIRDWLISRQRYWGCPIPIIHCDKCGEVVVETKDLPVELPEIKSFSNNEGSPLENNEDWINVLCPECGNKAKRETDTMDTFMCSSWYFFRFADPKNKSLPFDKNKINQWFPIDQYVGGIEHAILHLLYSRFLSKSLNALGLLDIDEPFKKLLTQGMVQSLTYKNPKTGKYIKNSEIEDITNPKDPETGINLVRIYEKMSKSKFNGVDPNIVIEKYGADTARLFVLFKAPPEKDLEWNQDDVEGQHRFILRLWKLISKFTTKYIKHKDYSVNQLYETNNYCKSNKDKIVKKELHKGIYAINNDLTKTLQLNTAISELMKISNVISENLNDISKEIAIESISALIRLIAPFSPHIAEEFWHTIGGINSVHLEPWPIFDEDAIKSNDFKLIIQINGKTRGSMNLEKNKTKNEIEEIVIKSPIGKKWITNTNFKRIIYVEGKLINFVI